MSFAGDFASVGMKAVSVMIRDSVILHTDLTNIQSDVVIQWRFGPRETLIAEINEKLYIYPPSGIIDRLNLNPQKGDLTIRHINNDVSGLYEVRIIRKNSHTINKSFNLTISGE